MTTAAALSFEALQLDTAEFPGLDAVAWQNAQAVELETVPTPTASQPSIYVQQTLIGKSRYKVGPVTVRAMASSEYLFLRLDWAAPEPVLEVTDNDTWADACAIMIPVNGSADIATMGSPQQPVTVVQWIAGHDRPIIAEARGIGTTRRESGHGAGVVANWADGRWNLMLSCPFDDAVLTLPGKGTTAIAVAIWSGAAAERAGVKSYTPVWAELTIS